LQGVVGEPVEAAQVIGVKEFLGEEIGNGIDHPEEDWLVQTCLGQDHDHGMSDGARGNVRVPEAERDAVRSIGMALLRISQGAVREQNMKGLPIRTGNHGHGLAQAAQKALFTAMNAVRAKVEIPMRNVLLELGFIVHGAALQEKTKSR
jgi:hypothetical protein